MFGSKKTDKSQYINDLTISNSNDTCNGAPKVTSTPLHAASSRLRKNSLIYSPPKKNLNTRRYSLSEISSSTSKLNMGNKSQWPGPLLASLNYKDNISMYEETRSSGLVERVVSYNKEAERLPEPTHQEKYNSPGLFPIVHLFKRKPPILEQSSNKVKISLSNSGSLSHLPIPSKTFDEARSFKNKHNLLSNNQTANESSTKSVLDALKEISRKRIHSNEDFDNGNEESGKRIRTELPNGSVSHSKRGRENSPNVTQEVSPKQTQKKLCVYDEYAASKSSTDFSFLKNMEPKQAKRKTISTCTDSFKEPKRKLISVETQTVPSTEKDTNGITSKQEDSDAALKKDDNSVKVFRDTPLDKIRKTRLTALMGNLVRKEAVIKQGAVQLEVEKKDENKSKIVPEQNTEKHTAFAVEQIKEKVISDEVDKQEITSIMTSPKTIKESPIAKADKHVRFDLSGTMSQKSIQATDSATSAISVSATNTFSSVNAPTDSSTAKTFTFNTTTASVPTLSFGQSSAVSDKISNSTKETVKNVTMLSNSSKLADSTLNEQPVVSPVKGGFKFDLKMPLNEPVSSGTVVSKTTTNSTPNVIFSSSPPFANIVTTTVASSNDKGANFSMGSNAAKLVSIAPVTKLPSPSFSFGKTPEEKKQVGAPVKTTFSITSSTDGNNTVKQSAVTFSFNNKSPAGFGPNTTTASTSSASSTTPSFSFNNQQVLKSTTFNFANVSNTTEPPKTTSTASSSFSFGPGAGNSNVGPVSLIASTAPPTFSSAATTASSGFGSGNIGVALDVSTKPTFNISGNEGFGKVVAQTTTVTTTTTCPVSSTFTFGGGATVSSSKPFGFGGSAATTPASSLFGSLQTTAASKDDKTSKTTPAFGTTNISFKPTTTAACTSFGSGQASSTAAIFGNAATTSAPMFTANTVSSAPVFGTSLSAPVFGTASSTFGSPAVTSAPAFGTEKKTSFASGNVFGNAANAPTFGSAATSAFGQPPAKPLFGASNPPSNAAPTFGTSGVGSTFGTTTPSSSSTFDTTATASSFSFGSNPTFSFGSGTETKPSPRFGAGGTSAAGFGKPTTTQGTPQFGANDNKAFNSTFTTSTFGNSATSFGANAPTFGASNNNGFGGQTQPQNSGFNFNATPASGSFMSTDTSKPAFNFTGTPSNQTFGSNTSGAFSSFNAPVAAFGASGTATGAVFSIGSGSTSNRTRTPVRAKRRT
ncbi:uncharacterized protein LOC143202877 [Rhynchophorus ferrugineus]|uniref:uncharacterized protein LOC143202877 n=1 Tax=Rhynchophorus ferrugineus TaxID=354439 RepID=UPI003FCDAD5F